MSPPAKSNAPSPAREVSPGAEGPATPGHDDGSHIVVLVCPVEKPDEVRDHLSRHGVELLGPIEGDGRNAILDLVQHVIRAHSDPLSDLTFKN